MADNSGTYGIKGLPRPRDAVTRHPEGGIPYVENLPVRYEISVLASSTDPLLRKQWTLLVLALERFKLKPVNEKLSYFQVAGIVSLVASIELMYAYNITAWVSRRRLG
jgi:tyrosinase